MKIKINNQKSLNSAGLAPEGYLNRDFWDEKVLLLDIEEALRSIASDIINSMDIEAEIKDIIITGSIAGYNWHELSDIDLHIVLDYTEISENFELVKRMLDQSRINWNKTHDIFIRNHEVELYFQHIDEDHKSNGVWSLMHRTWITEPTREEAPIDLRTTEKKAEMIAKTIDHIQDLYDRKEYGQAFEAARKVKMKISRMRRFGLMRGGIYSPENLAFKMLRNSEYLEKLSFLKLSSYDKKMSINEIYIKDYFSDKSDAEHLEFGDGGGAEALLDPNSEAPWGNVEDDFG